MTRLQDDLVRLRERILRTDPEERYRFHQPLAELIERMDLAGLPVSADIRDLSAELTCAAMEAEFDNVPV